MGATNIHVVQKGATMKEAFAAAVEDANDEYGHQQCYSGAINSCHLTGDHTSMYKKLGEEEFEEWAENNTDKREVVGHYDKESDEIAIGDCNCITIN